MEEENGVARSLPEIILARLEEDMRHMRSTLRSHGGDVVVSSVNDEGEVSIEFVGACRGCPAKAFTHASVVLPVLERSAGVTAVFAPQVKVAEAALSRMRRAAPRAVRDEPSSSN